MLDFYSVVALRLLVGVILIHLSILNMVNSTLNRDCFNMTERCPSDMDSWYERAREFECNGHNPGMYTCILTPDDKLMETCMHRNEIEAGVTGCPMANICGRNGPGLVPSSLFSDCPENLTGCPKSYHHGYYTTQLYLYPRCLLRKVDRYKETEQGMKQPRSSRTSSFKDSSLSTDNDDVPAKVPNSQNSSTPLPLHETERPGSGGNTALIVLFVISLLVILALAVFLFMIVRLLRSKGIPVSQAFKMSKKKPKENSAAESGVPMCNGEIPMISGSEDREGADQQEPLRSGDEKV